MTQPRTNTAEQDLRFESFDFFAKKYLATTHSRLGIRQAEMNMPVSFFKFV